MKTKIVYVVTGSEDGILGVYGNKKGAYEQAVWYVNHPEDTKNGKWIDVISYSKVCKELKDVYNYSVSIIEYKYPCDFECNATIHAVLWNDGLNKGAGR